jgi:hypothetical protein
MNTRNQPPAEEKKGFWDTAAGGIFPGLAGGVVMLLVLTAGGFLSGYTPAQVLGAFDTASGLPLRGALIHLAISCVYGAVFALLRRGLPARLYSPLSFILLGLLYGLLLWSLAVSVLSQAAAALLSAAVPGVFLLAHLAFGLTLGLAAGRRLGSLLPKRLVTTGRHKV